MASKFKGKSGKARVSKIAAASAEASTENERSPLFDEGKFRVGAVHCEQPPPVPGKSWEGIIVRCEGRGDDEEIGERAALYATNQKALAQSAPRLRSLCRSLVGLGKDRDEDFRAFDPHGEFQDAIYQNEMQVAAEYLAANGKKLGLKLDADEALTKLEEAEVIAVVSLGGETDDGDRYRNVSFRPVEADSDGDSDDVEEDEEEEERPAKRKAKASKSSKRRDEEEYDEDEDEEEDDEDEEEDDEDEDSDDEPPPRKAKASKKAKGRK